MMKISLLAMPWMTFCYPQASIGALAAYIRKRVPNMHLDCRYEYLRVWQKVPDEYEILSKIMTEHFYCGHLYPERRERIKKSISALRSIVHSPASNYVGKNDISEELVEKMYSATEVHLSEVASELAQQYDLVGMSASFSQLFSSLALAKRIKQQNPNVMIVLGGAQVVHFPVSIMRLFPFVDFLIPGEGEIPFLDLIQGLRRSQKEFEIESGVLTQKNIASLGSNNIPLGIETLPDLDQLPTPDYREYFQLAEELNIQSTIPIEGGRGCWWNRAEETGNPDAACYFCGFNARKRHRQKQAKKVVEEMVQLSESFKSTRFLFTEASFRRKGLIELSRLLQAANKHFLFGCAVRPDASPLEILELRDAGCWSIEPGIEGLSNSLLKRIHKGTSVLQILQMMKTCFELDLPYNFNLIVNFPGTTQQEINETTDNLLHYGICYLPAVPQYGSTGVITYTVEPNSTVFCKPEKFNVANIRNNKSYIDCLPSEVSRHLLLFNLAFDDLNPQADWGGLVEALRQVDGLYHRLLERHQQHKQSCMPLYYLDGGSFLEITDQRLTHRLITLENEWRRVYLYCTRIRSHSEIMEAFSGSARAKNLEDEILPALVAEKLMVEENRHYLSLATAVRPDLAAKRIRAQFDPFMDANHRV